MSDPTRNVELNQRLRELLPGMWVEVWPCADGEPLISLDGEFTVEELETVIVIVRAAGRGTNYDPT